MRWLIVPVLFVLSLSVTTAGPVRIVGDPMRDVQQTIQARKLLADEPELAAWNIGVSVQDRVATLWGPVPSAEIAFRAELTLRTIIELADVRNELFITDAVKPMRLPLKIDNLPSAIPEQLPPPVSPRWSEPGRDPFQPRFFRSLPTFIRVD